MATISGTRLRAGVSGLLPAAAAVALTLALAPAASAQQPACDGVLDRGADLAAILASVPKFAGTYVLVYREDNELGLATPESAAAEARIAAYDASPGIGIAEQVFGRPAATSAYDPAQPAALITAVLAGDVDGAIVWAPLAGLAAGELDFDYALSLKTVGPPSPPPPFASDGAASAAAAAADPCADEIRGLLEGYGVIAAEQLVPVDINDLLSLGPLPRDLASAEASLPLYAQHCARCHGPEAVAATGALAPVDLVRSVQRFSWPGFLYIVQNGRQQNGMPGFRGSLAQAEVAAIYQYVRERAHGTIQPSTAALEAAASQVPPPATSEPAATPDPDR